MQDEVKTLEGYVTTTEAAQITGRDDSTFRHALNGGRVPGALKFGKTWMIPRAALARYIETGEWNGPSLS